MLKSARAYISTAQELWLPMDKRMHSMAEERKPLILLEFLFSESAEAAQHAASDRLLTWAEAFDEWLAELGAKYTQSTTKQARLAWRRLLQNQGMYLPQISGESVKEF